MKLIYEDLNLHLSEPFVSNKGTISRISQFLVRLHWKGLTGLGTVVFAKEYGMTDETVRAALDAFAKLVEGATPYEAEQVLTRLEGAVHRQPTAVAAVDMAIHDLIGQIAGLPLHRLWGLEGLPVGPTGLSLGALPADELIERARKMARWPILKLKMTPGSDIQIVGRLRDVYDGRIWIDGNGSWDAEQAVAAAKDFHRYGVELLEQPVRSGQLDAMRYVREHSHVPIVADEDCIGPDDVLKLRGCADVINIKLLKCGGLRRAHEMIRLARRAGLQVMLGCKTESVVGITAMAQLAGLGDYLDLDGNLDLCDDPFVGITVDDYGRIKLPEGPGLGIKRMEAEHNETSLCNP